MHFLDQAKIFISSGAGGAGAVSFRREKFMEYGGPNGGEGGKGGDIVFEAVAGLNTLIDFRYTQHFRAPRGKGGAGSNMTGAGGKDLVIRVPVGTQILEDDEDRSLLADFTHEGQTIHFLKGGDGGRGNASYKTSTNRAPRQHGTGWPGEERYVWLRLKLMADCGLIGLPNAGKSTFLNRTTNAVAKVGEYPFTTLRPQLGVVRHKQREFVLADIPGLIEGAAEGAGIGDRFLGHVERTRVLLHLVDAAGDDPVEAWRVVRGELAAYGAGLEDKPEVLALSRTDLLQPAELKKIEKKLPRLYESDDGDFRRALSALLGPQIVEGNKVETLLNGDQIFPSMLAAIRAAKSTITFETYIYWSGSIGREFVDALQERARAGVRVHVLLDWVGSLKMEQALLDEMKQAGVQVERFHEPEWS